MSEDAGNIFVLECTIQFLNQQPVGFKWKLLIFIVITGINRSVTPRKFSWEPIYSLRWVKSHIGVNCVHSTQLTAVKLHCFLSPPAPPSHSEPAEREGVRENKNQLTACLYCKEMTACRKASMKRIDNNRFAVPLPFHHLSQAVQNAPLQFLAVAGRGGRH